MTQDEFATTATLHELLVIGLASLRTLEKRPDYTIKMRVLGQQTDFQRWTCSMAGAVVLHQGWVRLAGYPDAESSVLNEAAMPEPVGDRLYALAALATGDIAIAYSHLHGFGYYPEPDPGVWPGCRYGYDRTRWHQAMDELHTYLKAKGW